MKSAPRFALMSLAQTQMIQRTCGTKTMKQFHEHFSTVRELLPVQLRAPVGALQIPRSIKFYTLTQPFSAIAKTSQNTWEVHTQEAREAGIWPWVL